MSQEIFLPPKAGRTEIKWGGGCLPGFLAELFRAFSTLFQLADRSPHRRSLEVSFAWLRIPFNDFVPLGRDIRFRFTFYSRSSRFPSAVLSCIYLDALALLPRILSKIASEKLFGGIREGSKNPKKLTVNLFWTLSPNNTECSLSPFFLVTFDLIHLVLVSV